MEKNFEELTESSISHDLEEEKVRDKAYLTILPKRLTEYLTRPYTMDRTNQLQTDYENERRSCKR